MTAQNEYMIARPAQDLQTDQTAVFAGEVYSVISPAIQGRKAMLDQLRRSIEDRLADVLSEADKLRRALAALGPNGSATTAPRRDRFTASRPRAASVSRRPARAARSDGAAKPAGEDRTAAVTGIRRSGATKQAVLAALSDGSAMTASEVAAATGLGRASVSTTLSKLARSGEITKAARGYQFAGHAAAEATTASDQASDGNRNAASAPVRPPRHRPTPRQTTGVEPEPAAEGRPRGGRRRGEELSADSVAAVLAERQEGLSAVALAKQFSASDRRVLAVLRELEAAGRARREGSRRTSRWVAITDEERIAARAAELEARSRPAKAVA